VSDFSVSQRELRPGYQVIELVGELDLAVADRLGSAIDAVDSGTRVLILDMEHCAFMDSTGLATVLAARQKFEQSGRRLAVCAPGLQVKRLFSITGSADNGLVFDSVDEAAADHPHDG
jgi:anti-anti-sigma factor